MLAGKQSSVTRDFSAAVSHDGAVRLVALAGAICGLILLALGGPWLMSALVALRADPVLASVERGEQPTPEALSQIVDSRHGASMWHGDSRAWLAVGLARLETARREQEDGLLRRRLLDRAIFALEHALAMAPDNALASVRLGEALLMRSGASPRTARAVKKSLEATPVTPQLAVERLKLSFATWELFDAEIRARIVHEAEIAARNPQSAPALAALMKSAEGKDYAALLQSLFARPVR